MRNNHWLLKKILSLTSVMRASSRQRVYQDRRTNGYLGL